MRSSASALPGVALEPNDPAQRHWRFRVDQEGKAAILGEAGSHAYHMACYITGLGAEEVSAVMSTYAPSREVYDNAYLTLRFSEGAQGRLWYSYVAAGNDHGLTIKVFGETGSLIWWQEEGEVLWHKPMGAPAIRLARGYDELSAEAMVATRVREGHPEGYLMAFANLYKRIRSGDHGPQSVASLSVGYFTAADRRGWRARYGADRSGGSVERRGPSLGRLPARCAERLSSRLIHG